MAIHIVVSFQGHEKWHAGESVRMPLTSEVSSFYLTAPWVGTELGERQSVEFRLDDTGRRGAPIPTRRW
eukprot:scaffold11094_cov176-Amphora_coffeaeformis.AAC.4